MKLRASHGPRAWAIVTAALVLLFVGATPRQARAGDPTDTLRPAVDAVLSILADPGLKGAERTAERRTAMSGVMERVIDFPEAAQRALALHWRARTDPEREEFVRLFKDLVTYSYIVQIEPYAGQQIVFVGESVDGDVATVMTRVHPRQGSPTPVDYRMHRRQHGWLVYDVIVEGVSLVANYRAQFNTVVRTSSYPDLVRRLKARVAELTGRPVASRSLEDAGRARAGLFLVLLGRR
jgi:phospholipid transport system substrate-binding protein